MTTPTDVQIIHHCGKPAFAVVPYAMWLELTDKKDEVYFPHEVIGHQLKGDSLIVAWRKYHRKTQMDMANRLNITQSAYAQMEKTGVKPREITLSKIAKALGVHIDQLRE